MRECRGKQQWKLSRWGMLEDMSRLLLVGLVCQAVFELRLMFPLHFITPGIVFGPLSSSLTLLS